MKNIVLKPEAEQPSIQQQKQHIMAEIKALQRDLIKASFKQSSAPGAYAELLQAINDKRASLKAMS